MKFINDELKKDQAAGGKKVGVLLALDIQEKGKEITALSHLDEEQEVLLMPGTKFEVDEKSVEYPGRINQEIFKFWLVTAKQLTEAEQRKRGMESSSQPKSGEEEQMPKPQRRAPAPPVNATNLPKGIDDLRQGRFS